MKNLLFLFILLSLVYCSEKNNEHNSVSAKNDNYIMATDYRDNGKTDSAFFFYSIAKDEYSKINDTIGCAKSLINMAIIQTDKGDFFGGIETSLEAEKYLKNSDSLTQQLKSSNYNNLALASEKQGNYENAENYYFLALQNTEDKESKHIYYNNIGNNYLDSKNYFKAREYYQKALETKDSISYARALNNYARSYFLENKDRDVLQYLLKALKIREALKDDWGLNSSYSTLANYYNEKDREKSLFYAKKMHEVAKKINNPDDQLEAIQKIINLDVPENSLKYFKEFQKLNDSIQTVRNNAKNQFALIRYEAEKSKAENEKLKADSAKNENEILKRNIIVGLLIIGFIFSAFWHKKRQKLQAQQEQIKIKNTELKYSKKVHDVVANGLYQTIVEIENKPELDRENLLNQIEKLYEESRDIAQGDLSENLEKDFATKLSQVVLSYNSDQHKIFLVGNDSLLWENVSGKIQSELYFVVRELLINMKKHSKAQLISLKFEKNDEDLKIKYVDNGIGIIDLETNKGSGIKNTENRIESIGGEINFEKNPKGGLIIHISIPIL